MKLIIVDEYPENGSKTFVVSIAVLERLLYYFDFGVPLPDPRSPTLRAPVRAEQKCPTCGADCLPLIDDLEHFCPACGTSLGISKRSAGG